MRLKTQIQLLLLAILVASVGCYAYIQYRVVYRGFEAIEYGKAVQDIRRIVDAINREGHHLDVMTTDWGNWDEMYQFIQDRNAQFEAANLKIDALNSAKLDLLCLLDNGPSIVWCKALDSQSRDPTTLQEFSGVALSNTHPLIVGAGVSSPYILMTEKGLMWVASRPILPSDGKGPRRGTLIMGRFIDDAQVENLRDQTHIDFRLWNVRAELLPIEVRQVLSQGQYSDPVIPIATKKDTLEAYAVMMDLTARPALVVEAKIPRIITAAGRASVCYALLSIVFVSIAVLVVLVVFLQCRIVGPLGQLAHHIDAVNRSEDLSGRTPISSRDEIGDLSGAYNAMLDRLSEDHHLRIEAENRLREAKLIAEAASQSKTQFLANMSHEIRTPMNAIMGFGDLLADEDLTETQREYVDFVRTSSEGLLQIIDDILDFAKIESGKMTIQKVDCPLDRLLATVESMMRPAAERKGLDFRIVCEGVLPNRIHTDSLRLRQCLINLTYNAIKFTSKGSVQIVVSRCSALGGDSIRFDVVDTGIGVPADRQEAIFETFTQMDESTPGKYGGSGLGLTITRQLCRLLGGQIGLQSEVNKGSTFTVMIPSGVEAQGSGLSAKPEAEPDQGPCPLFRGRVLVADDDVASREVMRLALGRLGLEVVLVVDGQQAVSKALTESFDLILMNIQMPVLNGYLATKAIRSHGLGVPIVAVTAYATIEHQQRALEAGFDRFLAKPFRINQLAEVIRVYVAELTKTGSHLHLPLIP